MQYTNNKSLLVDINYVRRYKETYILMELVGEKGRRVIDYYRNNMEGSMIEWKDTQYSLSQPTKG